MTFTVGGTLLSDSANKTAVETFFTNYGSLLSGADLDDFFIGLPTALPTSGEGWKVVYNGDYSYTFYYVDSVGNLARLAGDDPATPPLFTGVKVPNFKGDAADFFATKAGTAISVDLTAYLVQADWNEYTGGEDYETAFSA
jgi:hypothetical protein